ncbi:hypothetical protein HK105_206159 [Polyrhizophydium stewartii]|uniref:Ankyrin repeat protein n=1 Tax=Polyrhizophydium stewartii TaxID=2732419 RepID=A0ABR4N4D5_9FUNG
MYPRTPTPKVVPTDPATVAALAAVLARIDALEQQRTAQHAARLTANADHLAAGVAALRLEPAAAAPPAAPASYRRTNGFRPDATNEWDRMPAEVQRMILAAAGPFNQFVNGLLLRAELNGLSVRQQEQVWQDAADADWQGDLSLLPPLTYAIRLPSIRTRAFYSRLKAVCDREDLDRVAVRNGWADMLDFGKPDQLAKCAASEGDVELLRDLIDVRKAAKPSTSFALKAANNGHLECIQFLHERNPDVLRDYRVGNYAAESGNLDLVVWLSKHRPDCITDYTIAAAADKNHVHIVRWLVDNVCDECDTQAICYALVNDNMELVEYLHIMFPGILDEYSPYGKYIASDIRVIEWLDARGYINPQGLIQHLAEKGKIDVLDWARGRFQVELQERDLERVFYHRHIAVLKQAYERGVPFTSKSAERAARHSNTEIMSWIMSRDRSMMPMLLDASKRHGDDALLEWWRVWHGVVLEQQDLEAAIRTGDVGLFSSLLCKNSIEWDLDAALEVLAQADISDRKKDTMNGYIRRKIHGPDDEDEMGFGLFD